MGWGKYGILSFHGLKLLNFDLNGSLSFLELQLDDCRSWELLASLICVSHSLIMRRCVLFLSKTQSNSGIFVFH